MMGHVYGRRGLRFSKAFTPGEMMHPASDLHDTLAGRPLVIMGNAYSLNYLKLDEIFHFKTLGCNRCIHPDFNVKRHPDYYTCVDRDPYSQVREVLESGRYKGIPVLAESLFDPNVSSGKPKTHRPNPQPVQPYPDYEWWGYRAVSTSNPRHNHGYVYTTCPLIERASTRTGLIRIFEPDLANLHPGAANIAYSMLQVAVGLGANPIGICGIDLEWESKNKSHAIGSGNGREYGAFGFNTSRVLRFFAAAYDWCRRNGVEVFNLSPKGVLSPTIPKLPTATFYKQFGEFAEGDLLYTRQQRSLKGAQPRRFSREWRTHHRPQPNIEGLRPELVADSRREGYRGRAGTIAKRKAEAAALARARRDARKRTQGA